MKINRGKKYYLTHANDFGWGPKKSKLNRERAALLDKFVVGKKVLDIGCGTGTYVDYLTKKGLEETGIDFVPEFITYAKKNRKGKFLVANAYKLPFKDKSFDTVIMFDVLEHLKYEYVAVKELIRICRNRLVLTVPHETNNELKKIGLVYRHYIDRSHLRIYSLYALEKLFKEFKIKILLVKELNFLPVETIVNLLIIRKSLIKKIFIKILILFFKTKQFGSDLFIVGEI
jgi:ubiquinone/menaquinone biosynthesis C-methylase UbiE